MHLEREEYSKTSIPERDIEKYSDVLQISQRFEKLWTTMHNMLQKFVNQH
jgi:hypothetical protein